MSLQLILFIFFGSISAVSSVLMITRKDVVVSALFLVLNFAGLAGIYITLNAQFIAVVQVIVYAGAIMVLFLFVIMLLRPENEKKFLEANPSIKIFAVIIGAVIFFQLIYLIFFNNAHNPTNVGIEESIKAGTIEEIGKQLYTNYILPFEAAGFLLLAATIGALVLAKKKFG
ncbi:MAG: NADH-quinone oxidoreductase subunit J [Ignavibacteriales bacterium CG_4_9_14_3_um_filter_30_11]|nr:MAG: NADH-quinone oxidoreductase subunit J [Ignavibacteriales bacterium CG_4_9_14_3_um_filter_30_11]